MMKDLKYPKEIISRIAQNIDMGMICFINTDTMEYDYIPGEGYDAFDNNEREDLFREVFDKINSWEHLIRIAPPESWQSFRIMEQFIENCIPDNDTLKKRLWDALDRRKPFRNFKFIIDDSEYRQRWFDFKQSQLEQLVLEELSYREDEDETIVE